jgi:hypothetical protein
MGQEKCLDWKRVPNAGTRVLLQAIPCEPPKLPSLDTMPIEMPWRDRTAEFRTIAKSCQALIP